MIDAMPTIPYFDGLACSGIVFLIVVVACVLRLITSSQRLP